MKTLHNRGKRENSSLCDDRRFRGTQTIGGINEPLRQEMIRSTVIIFHCLPPPYECDSFQPKLNEHPLFLASYGSCASARRNSRRADGLFRLGLGIFTRRRIGGTFRQVSVITQARISEARKKGAVKLRSHVCAWVSYRRMKDSGPSRINNTSFGIKALSESGSVLQRNT